LKCFYHRDLDGECSAAIIKYRFPECQTYSINYGEEFPWKVLNNKNETVYMVDFSLQPFTDMIKLYEKCNLIWIDHHISAVKESLENHTHYIEGIRDTLTAACHLTWGYIFPDKLMPIPVYLLGQYDIWDHTNPLTLLFQYGMRLKNTSPEDNMDLWSGLFNQLYGFKQIADQGEIILEYETKKGIEICKEYAFETTMTKKDDTEKVYKVICINIGKTSSKVFDSVYDDKKHDLMVTFCLIKNKIWTVSLYSTKNDIDCSDIAKSYGGGGHETAAGFQCKKLPFGY
jgi:uncharacterized protein